MVAGGSGGDHAQRPRAVVQELSDAEGVITVRVAGEVDLSSQAILRYHLEQALERSPAKLIIEAGDLAFIDSSGLALLIIAAGRVPELEVRNPTEAVRRVISIAGLTETLGVEPDA